MAQQQPSAAAAAGAAAAALLQKQLAADDAAGAEATPEGWSEHQTGDGRKFYFHKESEVSCWEKPEALMSSEERANDTPWREYKIWDGRAFYHNRETKVSCWSMPPELRKLRGESSGVDDRPLPQSVAERRSAFMALLKQKGVDAAWTWSMLCESVREEPVALALPEVLQKQCFAEMLGYHLRKGQADARERDRSAAGAFERLIEERFSRAEDMGVTYEEASQLLSSQPAWRLIKSDVCRDEVFQAVMERMEERLKKTRADDRAGRVVRLQRLLATDHELRRQRLRWKDAKMILARKDELQEDDPPLEALRVWNSLADLKAAAAHGGDATHQTDVAQADSVRHARQDRKRRDAFVESMKNMAIRSEIASDSTWKDFKAVGKTDPNYIALQDSPGATAMELFEEFLDQIRQQGPEAVLGVMPGSVEALAMIEARAAAAAAEEAAAAPTAAGEDTRPRKRQRKGGFDPDPIAAAADEPADESNALDAMIANMAPAPTAAQQRAGDDDDDDPFAEVVAQKERRAAAMMAAMGK